MSGIDIDITPEELRRRIYSSSSTEDDDRPRCPRCDSPSSVVRVKARHEDGLDYRCDICGARYAVEGRRAGEWEPADTPSGDYRTRGGRREGRKTGEMND